MNWAVCLKKFVIENVLLQPILVKRNWFGYAVQCTKKGISSSTQSKEHYLQMLLPCIDLFLLQLEVYNILIVQVDIVDGLEYSWKYNFQF